jgi:hypothetical protein
MRLAECGRDENQELDPRTVSILAHSRGAAGSKVKACYISSMGLGLKELLEKAEFWPEEDREELVEAAAEIEARRTGRYAMTDAEEAAVNNGLEQVRRGEFASDVEMQSFWKRIGLARPW